MNVRIRIREKCLHSRKNFFFLLCSNTLRGRRKGSKRGWISYSGKGNKEETEEIAEIEDILEGEDSEEMGL